MEFISLTFANLLSLNKDYWVLSQNVERKYINLQILTSTTLLSWTEYGLLRFVRNVKKCKCNYKKKLS